MKTITKTLLSSLFLFLATACNNDVEIDPVVGEYEVTLFNDLLMPIDEVQTEVGGGFFCDIERNGTVSFSNDLGFSLSVLERFFNCSNLSFNKDDSVIVLGSSQVNVIGSSYTTTVDFKNRRIDLDCNLQEDNLFCQGSNGDVILEFQATRVQ
jgi:hypothetical protein